MSSSINSPINTAVNGPMNGPDAQPLLTIAIPTYNRARLLEQLLAALLKQREQLEQLAGETRVELIVSDNASPDETAAVVREYQQRGLQFRYIRNETNLGADGNILQCFEQARGKYVWIFGDDDVLLPGSLSRVLGYLESDNYDLVFHCAYGYQADYLAERPRKEHRPPEVISSPERFVRRVNEQGDLLYITTLIVNKERVLSGTGFAPKALMGTNVIQLSWVFAALKNLVKGLYVDEYTIAGGYIAGPAEGFNAAVVFGQNYKAAVERCLGNSRLGKLLIDQVLTVWFPRQWIAFRIRAGRISTSDSKRLLSSIFGSNPRYWFYAMPLVYAPLPVARVWRKVLRIVDAGEKFLSHAHNS